MKRNDPLLVVSSLIWLSFISSPVLSVLHSEFEVVLCYCLLLLLPLMCFKRVFVVCWTVNWKSIKTTAICVRAKRHQQKEIRIFAEFAKANTEKTDYWTNNTTGFWFRAETKEFLNREIGAEWKKSEKLNRSVHIIVYSKEIIVRFHFGSLCVTTKFA